MLVTILLACQPRSAPAEADTAAPVSVDAPYPVDPLTATQHLVRASVALRGHRPGLDELDAVVADESALAGIVDGYLDSPALGPVIRQMHGEFLLTDIFKDSYPAGFPAQGALRDLGANEINVAVTEAPGRLAEHIVLNGLPYTELVTAGYTMANPITAEVWGLPYQGDGGWEPTDFGDDRPAAGILSDHWYFVRHASTDENRQRARGAHVARALLCHDYMNREVLVPEGVSLTDGGSDAIRKNAVCVSCHQTLDPLGAYFAPHEGVIAPGYAGAYPYETWNPGNADSYDEPMFYGTRGGDLGELGMLIAEDPRFKRCTVRRFYAQVNGIDADDISAETVDRWLPALRDFQIKPLLRSMVLSDEFAAARPAASATEADIGQIHGLRRATPWQLARTIEDLTGFVWTTDIRYNLGSGRIGEIDLTDDVTLGFTTLAGGADGFDIWEPSRTASPTTLLVLRALAALAAAEVVEADFSGASPRLLTDVGPNDTDERAVRAQLARLHLRMYGEVLADDHEDLEASWTLFSSVLAESDDAAQAWTVTLYAMLQDPRILFY